MAIIKYRVEARGGLPSTSYEDGSVGSTWQYEEVYNPYKPGKLLTREQALEIIEENKLVLVHHNMFGCVCGMNHMSRCGRNTTAALAGKIDYKF